MILLTILDTGFLASLIFPLLVGFILMQITFTDVKDAQHPSRYLKAEKIKWAVILFVTSAGGSFITWLAGKESEKTLQNTYTLAQVSARLDSVSAILDSANSNKLDRLDSLNDNLAGTVADVKMLAGQTVTMSRDLKSASANIMDYVSSAESFCEISMIPWGNDKAQILISNSGKYPVNVTHVRICDLAVLDKLVNTGVRSLEQLAAAYLEFPNLGIYPVKAGKILGFMNSDFSRSVCQFNIEIFQENGSFSQTYVICKVKEKWLHANRVFMRVGDDIKKVREVIDKDIPRSMLPSAW